MPVVNLSGESHLGLVWSLKYISSKTHEGSQHTSEHRIIPLIDRRQNAGDRMSD